MNYDTRDQQKDADQKPVAATPPAKAKTGDVVVYWEDPSLAPRHAIVLSVGDDNSASMKVIMPGTRKGGGGVVRRDGVPFADKEKAGSWGLA